MPYLNYEPLIAETEYCLPSAPDLKNCKNCSVDDPKDCGALKGRQITIKGKLYV